MLVVRVIYCYDFSMIFLVLFSLLLQILFGGFGVSSEDLEASVLRKWTRSAAKEQRELLQVVEENTYRNVRFTGSDVVFELEVADSPEERTKGLMFRESMEERRGMIFLFDDEKLRHFWMKNTLIGLDMIFLDRDYKIVKIQANVPPCKEAETPVCPVYGSDLPAKYVVELNAGTAKKYGVREGNTLLYQEQK